jgi:hypothetical protein
MIEKSEFSKKDYLLLAFIGILFSLPFYLMPVSNPDLFWHLVTGKYIIENLKFPYTDFLSWTMYGKKWVNFEWLSQILYYLIYNFSGFWGLYFLKAILFAGSFYVFALISRLKKIYYLNLIWIIPLLSASILNSSDVRVDNFTVLFFSIILYKLEQFNDRNWNIKFRELLFASFIFVLWVNLHGGFFYGLILISIYFFSELISENIDFMQGKGNFSFIKSRNILIFFFLSLLFTLFNPNHYRIYSVIVEHYKYSADIQKYIMEWHDFDISKEYSRPYSILLIVTLVTFLLNFLKNRELKLRYVFSLFFFVLSSLLYIRNTLLAALILVLVFIDTIKEEVKEIKNSIIFSVFVLSLLSLHFNYTVKNEYENFKIDRFFFSSKNMVKFLKNNKDTLSNLRLYNTWTWGGYLDWSLYPDYKVFIDGRYIFVNMLEEYMESKDNVEDARKFIEKYNLELIIYPPESLYVVKDIKLKNGKTLKRYDPLYLVQMPQKDWACVYFDQKNIVLVKRNKVPKKWLLRNEYKYLKPLNFKNLQQDIIDGKAPLKEVEKEIFRYIRENEYDRDDEISLKLFNFYKQVKRLNKNKICRV